MAVTNGDSSNRSSGKLKKCASYFSDRRAAACRAVAGVALGLRWSCYASPFPAAGQASQHALGTRLGRRRAAHLPPGRPLRACAGRCLKQAPRPPPAPVWREPSAGMVVGVMRCSRYAWSCWWLFVAVLVCSTGAADLEQQVKLLQKQMNALLEGKQEEFQSLRTELGGGQSEVAALRQEVQELRQEVESLRGNRQRNDHLRVQWLSSAVSELRAELSEVSERERNASGQLRQAVQALAGADALRADAAEARAHMAAVRADAARALARADGAADDAKQAAVDAHAASAKCAAVRQQLLLAQADWSATIKTLKKTHVSRHTTKVEHEDANDNEVLPRAPSAGHTYGKEKEEHATRHQRALRHQVASLEAAQRALKSRVSGLEHRLERARANDSRTHAAAADQLRRSLLELLEAVEALQDKVDHALPDLQREISKAELAHAQLASSVALIREHQENQRASVKAVAGGLAALQDKLEVRAGSLQAQLLSVAALVNNTAAAAAAAGANGNSSSGGGGGGSCACASDRDDLQDARLDVVEARLQVENATANYVLGASGSGSGNDSGVVQLVQQLTAVQRDYRRIVAGLPKDCSAAAAGDASGLQLLSPDGLSRPLLAWCDRGWTVVQRRVDGSEDFNRRWQEYAAGFGSPAGEFWLGNEALHRLTAANCSSLRVDLRDIYGKRWHAEYGEFHVGPASDGYRLHVANYRGNASDALEYQQRMQFSAIDRDLDISNTHCAANYEGGWWFSHCQHANLNGRYNLGLTWFDASRNEWIAVAWSEMRVRTREGCHAGADVDATAAPLALEDDAGEDSQSPPPTAAAA
ncbi:protein scabrous [Schistocerca piceifrons]|uniref:protein scabrous n=1 Tax=Schistocerca piceifrons TaxID=274613 RepID=UPI001F5EF53D|nr:protein scabrous [Schistocerca piceifrons]